MSKNNRKLYKKLENKKKALNKKNKEGYKITNSLPETKKNEILYINSNSLNYLTKDLLEICRVFNKKYGLSIDQKYINYPSK